MDRKKARKKATELVSQMTLAEKASQLRYDAPAIMRLGIPAYNWWNEALHGVARAGQATIFPQAIGLGATFDTELLGQIADTIATEGRAKYNAYSQEEDRDIYKGLTFWSPNVNIFRDPRWGRGHETYGEDPYLTKELGVSFVKGLQGSGRGRRHGCLQSHQRRALLRKSFPSENTSRRLGLPGIFRFRLLGHQGFPRASYGNQHPGRVSCISTEQWLRSELRKHLSSHFESL